MKPTWLLFMLCLCLGACRRAEPQVSVAPVARAPLQSPNAKWIEVCPAAEWEPIVAARKFFEAQRYEDSLSCAVHASALTPGDPSAHALRGMSLAALSRLEEAQVAYARALAIDPNQTDALLGAARLYALLLPSTRERDELAALYSERGLLLPVVQKDRHLTVQFALLSAMAFNDLGDSRQSLQRAQTVLKIEPGNLDAQYERAVALFELCRFAEAKLAFVSLLEDPERSAYAHHHLALVLEREGNAKESDKHFSRARQLAPDEFPKPPSLSSTEFKLELDKALKGLPRDMRHDLEGVWVAAEEFPKDEDLLSSDPPLSPAILGLFRGPPLGESCESAGFKPCRSVALYRRNLMRAVRTREELREQIRVTLLHEVGHLRGEDDVELSARGLE